MTGLKDQSERPKRAWLKIALGLSVAANLLFVGFMAGAAVRQGGGEKHVARNPGLGAFGAPYMVALPDRERRAVIRELRNARRDGVPDRGARREMFQDVLGHLRATPFDAQALEAAVARQAAVTVTVQKSAQAAWLGVVTQMSEPERARYADAVEAVLRRGRLR